MNILKIIKNFFIKILDTSYNHHKLSLTLISIISISLFSNLKKLDVHITIDQLINKEFQSSKDYLNLKKEFKLGKFSTLILKKNQLPITTKELCTFRKDTQNLIIKHEDFSNNLSLLYLRRSELKIENETTTLNFPYALNLNCDSLTHPLDFSNILKSPWGDILISKDQKSLLHEFELEKTDESDFEISIVPKKAEILFSEFKNIKQDFKQFWAGEITYQYYFKKGLDYNNNLNGLILLIVGFIFWYFYGTFLSTLIFIFTVIYSSLVLFSLMSIFNVPIDILNNCLVLLLTVSSLGDFVFVSSLQAETHEHWLDSFKKIITPSFFTSFTTFIGFISLCTSDIEVIRRLGLWGGISGMIEWLTVMILLPPILKITLKNKTWIKRKDRKIFGILDHFSKNFFHPKISYFLLIILLTIPYSLKNLNISDSPDKLFKKRHPFRESIEFISDTFHFKGDVSLVFKDKDKINQNIQKIEILKNYPIVSKIENPYLNLSYFTKDIPPKYHSLIEENLKDTLSFKRFFSDTKARSVVYLKDIDMKNVEKLRVYVKNKLCADESCYLSGSLIAYADFSQTVPNTLIESFVFSIILVTIVIMFLAYYTNNIKNIFSLLTTSIWGVSATLLLISLLQIQMNFVTCVVISILVGMTGDNTIQYLLAGLDFETLSIGVKERTSASIINALTMICCSMIFLLYYFEPPSIFGLLLIFGLTASLIGDNWLLRGILKDE